MYISHVFVNVIAYFILLIFALFVYILLRYYDLISFDLPGVGWFLRRRETANILDALSLPAQEKKPIGMAMATLAETYPQRSIQSRLERVCRDIIGGGDWCESLYCRGLIGNSDRAVLQSAQRAGNLPWALVETADSNRRRLAYRLNALTQMCFPPIVLCFGAGVCFLALSVFMPLISLITRLAG
jgi:type II secretory pathway component PulF